MRGKQSASKDLEALNAGFAMAKGDDYVPPEVEKDLQSKSIDELVDLGRLGDRLKDAVRVRNGWVWIMLRRKVGHGNFKTAIHEHGLKYTEVWQDMCYARAVQRFPGLAGMITGRAIRHIISLPESAIHEIEERITGIPADEAKKISRSWIEKEYLKIQAEKERPKRKTPAAPLPPENTDEQWMRVKDLHAEAVLAMANLVAAAEGIEQWKPEYYDEVLERKMVRDLGRQFDRVIALLHPVDEMRKRGAVED